MADRIERIRARQTASSERYPTHIGCGAEVWQPHGSWVCARCGCVTLDAVMLPHQNVDDYAEDVGYLLQELDRARAQRDQLARHIEHAADPVFARVEGGKELRFGPHWDCGWADHYGRKGKRYPGLRSRAGLPDSTRYHDLRHTYATALVSGRYGPPWPLRAVQEALGHASQKTTERYAHLEPGALDDLAAQTAQAMRVGRARSERNTVDGCDVESDQRLREGQPRVCPVLRRANRSTLPRPRHALRGPR